MNTHVSHERHCEIAGCWHPSHYVFGPDEVLEGWCAACRYVGFGWNIEMPPEKVALIDKRCAAAGVAPGMSLHEDQYLRLLL